MTEEGTGKLTVVCYLNSHATMNFPARDERNAREIAKRIITEGAWVINKDGTEEFYPVAQIYKVKIIKENKGDI